MQVKTKRIIIFSAMALIFAVVLAANIVCGIFSEMITNYLYGYGVSKSTNTETLQKGDQLCRDIEGEGIVVLKNDDNALPLEAGPVNLFGWASTDKGFIVSGSGSGSSDERTEQEKVKLVKGLETAGFTCNPNLIKFYEDYKDKRDGTSLGSAASTFFRLIEPDVSEYSTTLMSDAIDYSDTAIIVISRLGGESKDLPTVQYKYDKSTDSSRHYLELSQEEEDLIEMVTDSFGKVVVLLNTCNSMELGFLENEKIAAAISVGGPGQSGAYSIGKLLTGEITPSGRTADTYAYDLTSDPSYVNAATQGVTNYTNGDKYIDYAEGVYVGYRYYETAAHENYIDYEKIVQYPFGFGMSYTKFTQEVVSVSPAAGSEITKDTKFEFTVEVTNTGTVKGKEVVQLYFTAPYYEKGIEKPYVQLCAFGKTTLLEPKQTETLKLTFDAYQLASYDVYNLNDNGFTGYELEHGKYQIKLQSDSHNLIAGEKSVTEYNVTNDLKYDKDPVSGGDVANRFTGENAYAGVSIDGKDSGANIKYMTRADFAGTFPKAKAAARERTDSVKKAANKFMPTQNDTDITPTQGQSGTLRLTENGQINDELMQALGSDYDDPQWEALLNQITVSELNTFVELAGYKTEKIDSIGKVKCIDLDGPSGLNQVNMTSADSSWVIYPVESVVACTFNPRLAYTLGLAVGKEAADTNVSGWYAPAVNIHRNPFDGRNFEYYSEDPYLSGIMGAETVRGATANGLYCYIKHFAVNETETAREGVYTWLDEQTLREIYLRPFEMAVKNGGANAMMSSFNRVGAVWAGGNYALLTEVLRDEWGFKGSVVTDWTTGGNYMNVDQGLRAGNDCWLSGQNTVGGHNDKTSATAISCARQAAKNMLYTYCNTYYVAKNHDSSQDSFVAEITLKQAKDHFPFWVFGLVAIDLAAVAGLGVWTYFTLRKKKEPVKAETQE